MSTQKPISGRAKTYAEMWRIITHPAFRLGFLDAQDDRPFDHDAIMARIASETPQGALKRLGWPQFGEKVDVAQYRYEEGRWAVFLLGLRCKAWGHPDYPPVALRKYIESRSSQG
jgi:hypothetical protein